MMHRPYPREETQAEPIYIGFEEPVNGLGIAGFIVSLVGALLTLGILCPIGILLSLVGLMHRPRGMALAGLVIGVLGTAVPLGTYYFLQQKRESEARFQQALNKTEAEIARATHEIEKLHSQDGELPEGIAGNKVVIRLRDGWKKELRYDRLEDGYVIRSAGPDGEFETNDDVTRRSNQRRIGRRH